MDVIHSDCRHFRGDRPCRFARVCENCPHHDPIRYRILLIKLGATGDVLRTTPLLPALHRAHPAAHLTWLTRPAARDLLEDLDGIDRLLTLDVDALAHLPAEEFDLLICLDKEPAATGLATRIRAREKRGFLLAGNGTLEPAHADSEYAFALGLDDELKFRRNQRSHQDIQFEMAGLAFQGEEYQLVLGDEHHRASEQELARIGVARGERVVGLNVGAGEAFAYKAWRADGFAELAARIHQGLGLRCALLGGARDQEVIAEVAALAEVPLLRPRPTGSIRQFAALVSRCAAVVSGDTLAMHLALAVGRPVVAIFGSTCPQEIELYGRGEKVVPKIDCHPCYKHRCFLARTCADVVGGDEVYSALRRVLEATP